MTACHAISAAPRAEACICCGASAWASHFRVLKRCGDCGFIRADMSVTQDEAERLYQEGYFTGAEYGDYLADAESHRRNFAERLRLARAVAGATLGPVLEIGCAYGFFLEQCRDAGIEATGVDVCVEPVRYARMTRGLDARVGDFLAMKLPEKRFRSVCMWDTIEHLEHPEAFVARAREVLVDDGMLFVTTGDIGAMFARWRGPKWRMIHPPTHLQYFSTASIARLLERQGYRVEYSRSTPMYRNIGETLGRLTTLARGTVGRVAAAAHKLTPRAIQRCGFWLDLGDIMYVAARKIP